MAGSNQNDLQSKSIIDAAFTLNQHTQQRLTMKKGRLTQQRLTQYEDGAQHIQPDDAQYYLVPPFSVSLSRDPPLPDILRFAYLPLGTTITPKELDIIKVTAQFAAVYGGFLRRDLMKRVSTNPQFEFLKSTHRMYHFYIRIALGYSRVLVRSELLKFKGSSTAPVLDGFFKLLRLVEKQEEGAEMAMTDLHAFEFFANMEKKVVRVPPRLWNLPSIPQPLMPQNDLQSGQNNSESRRISGLLTQNECGAQHIQPDKAQYYIVPPFSLSLSRDPPLPDILRFAFLPLGFPITRKELDIIKLTAQFAAVYGGFLRRDLMKRVSTNPQFEFLKSTHRMHHFYIRIALGYSRVLVRSELLKFKGSSTAPVIDGFFKLLRLVEKQEEGAEMAMTDLHAFEFFANMEKKVVRVPLRLWNQPPKMQPPGMSSLPAALVPEDQFIAQHPGPSTSNNGQVTEITAQSLLESVASLKGSCTSNNGQVITGESVLESVASLKEKIAGEMQNTRCVEKPGF